MSPPQAKILSEGHFEAAVQALLHGDVVGLPTETVYGLAGHAFDSAAVAKIFQVKGRPSFDPLIVHIPPQWHSTKALEEEQIIDLGSCTPREKQLIDHLIQTFWPGPLTLILPKHKSIPDLVTSGLAKVGVRMPAHPVAQKILEIAKIPLAAPSANRFGRISPTSAQDVFEELGSQISFIVDGGTCDVGIESTVIAPDGDQIWLLRPGKISSVQLEQACGVPVLKAESHLEKASPGMLESHYAPRKPLYITPLTEVSLRTLIQKYGDSLSVMITQGRETDVLKITKALGIKLTNLKVLSPTFKAVEVAQNLFSTLRWLDHDTSKFIVTNPITLEDDLWPAIKDRLGRAATKLDLE